MLLQKLQKLGMAASFDSCGGTKEKSYREYGIPQEYQNFIYNCTQTSENTFAGQIKNARYRHRADPQKNLYEKSTISRDEKEELKKQMPAGMQNRLGKCLLMKVLADNTCVHDCKYCVNTTCKEKLSLEPKELADSFIYLHNKGFVTGLFLSSAVHKSPQESTERMINGAKMIRERGYTGYIHAKVLPETPDYLIRELALYSNRLSVNLESATTQGMEELTTTKSYQSGILKKLRTLDSIQRESNRENPKTFGWFCDSEGINNGEDLRLKSFTTQIIVGANEENDLDILNRMDSLYEETSLYRTYFSAFTPVEGTCLSKKTPENKTREHRLYETDWLMRIYGFDKKLITSGLNENNFLPTAQDVKQSIAIANKHLFPLDLNSSTREELMLVPGFGPKTADKIIQVREEKKIKELSDLMDFGIRVGKAKTYLNIEGKQTNLYSY